MTAARARLLPTFAVALCLATQLSAARAQDAAEPRPRSVLFYVMDTCRQDRLSSHGYGRETTPFLEWLAERSVVFENCSSQAPWTKPSMASMLSSQYPSATGVFRMDQQLPDRFVTWPEVLQAHGLQTVGFSANIVMGSALSNFTQGFHHFVESTEVNGGDPIRFASGSAKKLNQHVFRWLDGSPQWPMLLYVHSVDPHEEYEPEAQYLERFADPDRHGQFREDWATLLESRPPIPGLYVTQDNFEQTQVDAASFVEHASNLYDADILANDDQLQRLWDKLQTEGWGEDFVFVFTSDHGEEFFDHGATSHGYSLYDEMIRVPLMIYAPGLLPAGRRVKTPVRSLDIYPTLCELMGVQPPEGLQGRSLLPLVRGEGTDAADVPDVISEHREDPILRRIGHGSGDMVSIRRGRWKFISNALGPQLLPRPRFELFDLEADPGERTNLADKHPELVHELEAEAVAFVQSQRAELVPETGVELDPEVLEQLRELGYIGEAEPVANIWDALRSEDLDTILRSLESGADPNQLEEVVGISPLSITAMVGNVQLARILVKAGARVDGANTDGSSALHGAAFLGRVDMLQFLLEQGADRSLKNALGDTALSAAATPWNITEFIAGMLELPVEREAVEAGRAECVAILEAEAL